MKKLFLFLAILACGLTTDWGNEQTITNLDDNSTTTSRNVRHFTIRMKRM